MKKITFITVIALLAALFATPLMAAESKDYTVGGLWNFTANIPETKVGESTISAAETGKIIINTTFKEDGEYIDSLIISSKGSYTIDGKTVPIVVDKKVSLPEPQKYTPGQSVYHRYERKDGETTYKEIMELKQTGENELTGEMTLYINDKEVAKGDVKATRPTWKVAGKWNYTTTIPEISVPGYTYSAKGTGTIDIRMKSGDIEGREYFDSYDIKYKETYKFNGEEDTDEGEAKGVDFSYLGLSGLYNIGARVNIEYQEELCKMRIECYQVDENKMEGIIYIIIEGQDPMKARTFEATRDTGSSSGCNAGATAAMLIFCAVPMIFRRKK